MMMSASSRCYYILLFLLVTTTTTLSSRALQDLPVFNELRFRRQVEQALQSVQAVLDTTRHPVILEDATNHTYEDKYALVETMTNTAIGASITILERLTGINFDDDDIMVLQTLLDWVHNQNRVVTLRFYLEQKCTLDRKTERKITTAEKEIERSYGGSGIIGRRTVETETVKIKSTIHEYHWIVEAPYSLSLVSGSDTIDLYRRGGGEGAVEGEDEDGTTDFRETIIISGDATSQPPSPVSNTTKTYDLNLTWLLQQLSLGRGDKNNGKVVTTTTQFTIHREADTCRTPSRNDDIEKVQSFRNELNVWAQNILMVFEGLEFAINMQQEKTPKNDHHMEKPPPFNPLLPLYENSAILGEKDFNKFLIQHKTDLDSAIDLIMKEDNNNKDNKGRLLSGKEESITYLIDQLTVVFTNWKNTIAYVEKMLENQLIQAIGKVIGPDEFDEFISFHSKRFFDEPYRPKPFSYAVRRGDHYPDGVISIEAERFSGSYDGKKKEPIQTISRHIPGGVEEADCASSIYIPVDAATAVEIRGDRYLHGWIQYQWNSHEKRPSQRKTYLIARAHQFSSFLVILGVMGGSNQFLPKEAIIVKNKDMVMIDLLTNVLPSAKEFQDAISSLSDEQKAFAQAFRGMQLESSVFGLAIIQIKPQLEKLLNLPDGSLTKEIQLTQDLMSLFVDYQIPSDLLSCDGSIEDATVSEKVGAVKNYVKAVMDVIENEKQKQLEQEKQKREMLEKKYGPTETQTASSSYARDERSVPEPLSGRGHRRMAAMMTDDVPLQVEQQSYMNVAQQSQMNVQAQAMHMEGEAMMLDDVPPQMAQHVAGETQSAKPQDSSSSNARQEQNSRPPIDSKKSAAAVEDFTMIPRILDAKLEDQSDTGLKSTTIKTGTTWYRSRQENLLLKPREQHLSTNQRLAEKNQAMDLLTAISRSGTLAIDASELHVFVAMTHCFENDIMNTVIKDNVNPIEKVENSLLLVGSTIQNQPASKLLAAADASQNEEVGLLEAQAEELEQ